MEDAAMLIERLRRNVTDVRTRIESRGCRRIFGLTPNGSTADDVGMAYLAARKPPLPRRLLDGASTMPRSTERSTGQA